MRKAKKVYNTEIESIVVDTDGLRKMCGGVSRNTAVMIGMAAGARVKIGRRVLWNKDKIQAYINAITGGLVE